MNLRDNCSYDIRIDSIIFWENKNLYRVLNLHKNPEKNIKLLCLEDDIIYENTSLQQIIWCLDNKKAKLNNKEIYDSSGS